MPMRAPHFKLPYVFVSLAVAIIGLIVFNFFYIFPLFDSLLLSSAESDGFQIATHVQRLAPASLEGIPPAREAMADILADFDLKRLAIHSTAKGKVFDTAADDAADLDAEIEAAKERLKEGKKTARIVTNHDAKVAGRTKSTISQVLVPVMTAGELQGVFAIERDISSLQNRQRRITQIAAVMLISAAGGILLFLWFLTRKAARTETKLRQAHAQLITAIDALPETFLVIDRNYQIVMANQAVRQAAGCDPVQQRLRCHQVSHHQDCPCTGNDDPCPLPLVLAHKRPVNVTHTHYTANGEARWVEITASPIFNDQGEVVRMIEACKDITRQKEAEQQLRQSKEKLESTNTRLQVAVDLANDLAIDALRANKTKGDFLANMSHEIRTPMNGIIAMADLLLSGTISEEQRGCLTVVRSSADALLNIINDILDFSKIEASGIVLENITFDLSALLEECCHLLAPGAQRKGVELVCHIDAHLPTMVQGDPGRLRQVLTNLIGNAIKFTAQGEIRLRACPVATTATPAQVRFEVSDTGIGITADTLPSLFQPFVQAEASTTRTFGGTGLGLAICRHLVELMGGEIGGKPQEDGGALFWFTIPLAELPQDSIIPRSAPPSAAWPTLIVDDSPSCRQWLHSLLDEQGWPPHEAASGAEALALLRQHRTAGQPYQVLLLDTTLPDREAESLAQEIQASPTDFGHPKVILMPPLGQQLDTERLHDLGVVGRLEKPVRRQALAFALERLTMGETCFQRHPAASRDLTPPGLGRVLWPGARVLLAEDNPTNQIVARGLLRKFGIEPTVVNNGEEAVAATETAPYDLLLMDCQMPTMDGIAATTAIRQGERTGERLPIVAMTAHALTGDRERFLLAGMDDYLPKPISIQELSRVLDTWLGWREMAATDGTTPLTSAPAGAPAPSPADTMVLDLNALSDRLQNDQELVRAVLQAFQEDMPQMLERLRQAIANDDCGQIKAQGHTIKGAAGNISALSLQDTARQVEMAGRETKTDQAAALLSRLEAQFEELQGAIRAITA